MARLELTWHVMPWSLELEGWLCRIDGIERDLSIYQARIENGDWQALGLQVNGETVAAMVWSVETDEAGSAVVINALGGKPVKGVDLTRAAAHLAKTCGAALGATTLRFWTEREGLKRKAEAMGFKSKYVLEGAI